MVMEQYEKVIQELKKCNDNDLDELAKIMLPRIMMVCERSEVSASHLLVMLVMLLMDLQGKP